MRRIVGLVGMVLCALAAMLAGVSPSGAQVAVPPARTSIDGNGVDLFLGTFNYATTDISIGQGAGLLAFSRSWEGGGWRNSLVGTIQASGAGVGATYWVSLGGGSDSFTKSSATAFTSQQGNGATLSYDGSATYTYTTTSGLVATFARNAGTTDPFAANDGRIVGLAFADGRRLDYAYRSQLYCLDGSDPCRGGHGHAIRLQSVRDNAGYMLKLGYAGDDLENPAGLVAWFTLASVTTINLAIDYCAPAADACAGLTRSWPAATYAVTASGTIAAVTDPVGRTWSYTIDGGNRLTGLRRPAGASDDVTIGYDAAGRVATYAAAGGGWSYAYADAGGVRTTVATDPSGHARTFLFDIALQRMTAFTNELGRTWSYAYDGDGRLTVATAPEGNVTSYGYDGYGNVASVVTTAKSGGATIATSAAFAACPGPACARPSATTDARGNVTDYTYTAIGQPATVTLPAPAAGAPRPQTRYAYAGLSAAYKQSAGAAPSAGSAISLPVTVSACRTAAAPCAPADESRTAIGYDTAAAGSNLAVASSASGSGDGALTATTTFAYDDLGDRTVTNGPLAGDEDSVVARYDAARDPLGAIGPDPDGAGPLKHRAIRYAYDGNGWPVRSERGTVDDYADPLSAMTVLLTEAADHDALGRVISRSVQSGGAAVVLTQYGYDASGRPQCTTVRMNPATYSSLPAACALATTGSYGPDRISRTSYDAAGRPVLVQQAYGTADQVDVAASSYTANGQPATLTDANGNVTTYTYDGFDRPDSIHYPNPAGGGSSATDYEQYSYDAASNVISFRLRDSVTVGMGYDALNRLVIRNGATVPARVFTWDNLGELTNATLTETVQGAGFSYDALGRVTSEVSPLGTFLIGYDLAGRRTSLIWPDGFAVSYNRYVTGELYYAAEAPSGYAPVAFYLDDLGRVTGFGKANAHNQTYGYDAASRLTALSVGLPGGTTVAYYAYNPASQMIARTTSDDALAANVAYNVDRSYAVNGLNQYTKAGAARIEHDLRGNTTRIAGATYAYDGDNLLTTAPGATLGYDALGRLYRSPEEGGTLFAYVAGALVGEYDGAANVRRRYLPGDDPDQPLVWYEGSGLADRRYLASDERGSITEVSGQAGTTLAINQYDDWGIPAATNLGRFGYTGQTWMPSVQAWNYKNRVYQPMLGRFLQADPIGYGDGFNLYRYVANDPLNFTDPSGTAVFIRPPPIPTTIEIVVNARKPATNYNKGNPLGLDDVDFAKPPNGTGPNFEDRDFPDPDLTSQDAQQLDKSTCTNLNVSLAAGASAILGKGGGFEVGVSYNYDNGSVSFFMTSRFGTGLGLTGGAGLTFSNSTPKSGISSSYNGSFGLGPFGASASTPGSLGSGISFGPDVGGELSKTDNLTSTATARQGNGKCSGS